jgi:hypothetical protein
VGLLAPAAAVDADGLEVEPPPEWGISGHAGRDFRAGSPAEALAGWPAAGPLSGESDDEVEAEIEVEVEVEAGWDADAVAYMVRSARPATEIVPVDLDLDFLDAASHLLAEAVGSVAEGLADSPLRPVDFDAASETVKQ